MLPGRTGLGQPEAERRADDVITLVKENISRARKSAVILAFSAGASALLGLVIAKCTARRGGGAIHINLENAVSVYWSERDNGTVIAFIGGEKTLS